MRPAVGAAQDSAADRSVVDGVFTAGQATAGREVFRRACASCHQLGDLAGPKFAFRWEKTTVGDLFTLISDTMPDGAPGTLEPREYAGILAMFLKESGYKEGDTELPTDVEALRKIKIEPLPQ
ncbi:MAG: hypothetical protein A3F70_10775 [Acidobacteria bacterium RIFCSPLOWO2_12_FULL_67_14]|nr:MAG: hypothetical protein A3H29_11005 [Acidobacteria bacterium RIFCSPLOWO2_02_FULL_67_21]OFW35281.1 MAG: hypothetical protein A3F70_10775 [Acidobacteria bacterium RIFCSPLOWO2_12_FULL_67_14]